jgi:hypothetical protein
MRSASYKHRSSRQSKVQKSSARFAYLAIFLCVIGLIVGGVAFRSSQPTQAATNQYAGIPGPDDWTAETPVQIYNRSNGQWEPMTYGDVGPDMEFIVGNYVYATTPEKGSLFLKPEIDISLLAETDRAFDPDNWRMPKPDDVVFLFRSSSNQQKGHWLLKHVQPDSEIVFQGKVWKWELDVENQRFVVSDTGNVFARVTQTHVNVHEGDVLALTIRYESCGKTGVITGSEEHPFFVLDTEQYIPMVDLKPNMALLTDNGTPATVVKLEPLDETMVMYNLTVEHVHNYFVYSDEGDPGILVHNTNCNIDPNKLTHIFGKAEHNLDPFVNSFGGSQDDAFRALQTEFSNVAGNYTNQQLNQGIQVVVNGYTVTVRGAIVDGTARIGTAFIP